MCQRKHKYPEHHAALRLAERTDADFESLRAAIDQNRHKVLQKQTVTRYLCRARIQGVWVYFVMHKKNRAVITVLTEDQARFHFSPTEWSELTGVAACG
jgi:hypothetical protein